VGAFSRGVSRGGRGQLLAPVFTMWCGGAGLGARVCSALTFFFGGAGSRQYVVDGLVNNVACMSGSAGSSCEIPVGARPDGIVFVLIAVMVLFFMFR
jgi:hypothetical protein